jgi:hypothetical protein
MTKLHDLTVQQLQVRGAGHGLEGPQGVDQGQRRGLHDAIGAQGGSGGSPGGVPGGSPGGLYFDDA